MIDIKNLYKISLIVVLLVVFATGHRSEEKPEYEYECGNKFYHYYLDDEPAEYGLSAGYYAPGKKAYVGISIWEGMLLDSGRVQLDPPGFLMPSVRTPGIFVNDSSKIWYLYKNRHHQYKWVSTNNGKIVPFAVEFGLKSSGFFSYIGRIKRNNTVLVGYVIPDMGVIFYVDENNNSEVSTEYEVLTCKSSRYEETIPPPKIPISISSTDLSSECVHNWQQYMYDDTPAKNGIIAGEYDCENTAFVGYGTPSTFTRAGRIQIVNQKGVYMDHKKSSFFLNDSSVHYLVDNPNYTYRWVPNDHSGMPPQNSVFVKSSSVGNFQLAVAKVKINGQTIIGFFAPPIAFFPTIDGNNDEMRFDFDILVCDPWPKYKCAQQWKKLNANDSNLSVDGFSVDNTSFIGRGRQKCINGCDYSLGTIQSNSTGVYYLDDLTKTAVFDNSSNVEYLVKNLSYSYKWQPSKNGLKVVNALKLHKEGHRPFYIGMTRINDHIVVGEIHPGDGLFFIDPVTGKQQSISFYKVLTCTSPYSSNDEYKEDANWFKSFGCPIKKQWSFFKWRCVCRDEFRNVFAFNGAKWSEETCSYF
ncbi:hypothetical protein PVAND_012367 [Polypedilum vanderplanki]|uniref:Uncharacterized protein n=1 Tax=Polypedilum vanderplanki TaxID=319348 RepID=A0A9J6CM73_POLVA|nr:hypothetical protein PVAND_012367 [Polypedilum vanderplanki]